MKRITESDENAKEVVALLRMHEATPDYVFVAAASSNYGYARAWETLNKGVYAVEFYEAEFNQEVWYAFVEHVEYAEDLAPLLLPERCNAITTHIAMANVYGLDFVRKFVRATHPYERKMHCVFVATRIPGESGRERITPATADSDGLPKVYSDYRAAQEDVREISASLRGKEVCTSDNAPIFAVIPITI